MFNILSLQSLTAVTAIDGVALTSTASYRCGGSSWSLLSWRCSGNLIG